MLHGLVMREHDVYVLLTVHISVAVWPGLRLSAASSCSSITASCKIKWRMTQHTPSKSEIAGAAAHCV